jgi:arylsulfatase A-like enzyme
VIATHSRRLATGWLAGLLAADMLVYLRVSPLWRGDLSAPFWLKTAVDLTATVFFWIGCFGLLAGIVCYLRRTPGTLVRRMVRAITILVGAAGFYYLFFVWIFVVRNGHLPNPETVVFLTENLSRLPQHIVQTSPLFALLGIVAAFAASWLSIASLNIILAERPVRRSAAHRLAPAVFVAAWYFIAPFGSYFSPVSLAMNRDEEVALQARVNLYLQAIKPLPSDQAPAPAQQPFPVVVLLVESLRHDLLTEAPQAIPFLKRLYEENIGFSRAYAVSSHSNLSDLAFWYGQYPLRGKGRESFPVDAPWRGTSMFRAFKDAGYRTAYISSQNEGWGNMGNWLKLPEVDYFFDSESYDGVTWENKDDVAGLAGMIQRGLLNAGKVEDSETLRIARQWIDAQAGKKNFFVGMNLQNTHFSYVMPPGGAEPFQPSDMGFRAVYYSWPAEKKQQVRNRYLNAVSNVDRLIEEFAGHLKRQGIWDETLFVVLGDNGEAFHEHGFGNHSGPMYDEVVRTLAVVKLPASLKTGRRHVERPVSHIDIAASVPHFAGLPVPATFQGLPLKVDSGGGRPVFMYCNAIVRQYGIVEGHWKLLINEHTEPREELFDLERDPRELNNVATEHRDVVKSLGEKLLLWVRVQTKYYETGLYTSKAPPIYADGPFAGKADQVSSAIAGQSQEKHIPAPALRPR